MIIVGIAGPSSSGKSTITNKICEKVNKKITIQIIAHDNYYKDQNDIPFSERVKVNYDHPKAFETELLVKHLNKLINNKNINVPIYDYKNHTRSKRTNLVKPADIIIVEGILTLKDKKLREMFDLSIYVDTDADECLIRRIKRDTKERERSLDSIIDQYLKTVKPMSKKYIETSKKYADIIIPNSIPNKKAIEIVSNHLNQITKS